MYIDTHAHLWWPSFTEATKDTDSLDHVLERARQKGVSKIIAPGTDLITSRAAIELAKKYPGTVYAAVGIHPEETVEKTNAVTESSTMFNAQMKKLRQLVHDYRDYIVAIGEIGTDSHTQDLRDHMTEQMNLFREQCEIALEADLAVIIHTRKSITETFRVLDSLPIQPRGQFHCFSYDTPELTDVLSRGYSVSFCGNITWSRRLQRLAASVPRDRLLLETDSPLMMPRDSHGEPVTDSLRNEPGNVTILAQFQAELRGDTVEELGRYTTENAVRLYTLRDYLST